MHARSLSEAELPDPQYAPIRDAIDNGQITRFPQLLEFIPASSLMDLLELDQDGLTKLTHDPELLQVKQLIKMANTFQVDLFQLVTALTGREM
jgi:hypothetical protein